ncbi:MAG: extracellular solute-binding protein [Anaerolineae bacterium]|nr:extracellular solute-binding protein [Anaerolineae bacterium]
MSRKFVVLLAVILVVLVSVSVSGAQEEPITLVFSNWHLGESQWGPVLNEAVEAFEAEHPNIDIVPEVVAYAERDVKYITEIEAGAGPDIFKIHNISFRNFMERGYLLDLTPFIEAEGEGFIDQWYPGAMQLMQWQDHYYMLPGEFQTMVFALNRNLVEAAGLDPDSPPQTWEAFLDYAQQLTRDTNGDGQVDTWGVGLIGAVNPGFELRFMPFMYSFGANVLNDDNTCSALNTPEAMAGFNSSPTS